MPSRWELVTRKEEEEGKEEHTCTMDQMNLTTAGGHHLHLLVRILSCKGTAPKLLHANNLVTVACQEVDSGRHHIFGVDHPIKIRHHNHGGVEEASHHNHAVAGRRTCRTRHHATPTEWA